MREKKVEWCDWEGEKMNFSNYLGKWGGRLNFGNIVIEIVRKSSREKKVEWCD